MNQTLEQVNLRERANELAHQISIVVNLSDLLRGKTTGIEGIEKRIKPDDTQYDESDTGTGQSQGACQRAGQPDLRIGRRFL